MSKERLRKLDEEDEKLIGELTEDRELTLDNLLGFRLPKAKCFLPPNPCGQIMAPAKSLVPMYEAVLLPIYSHYWAGSHRYRISKASVFEKQHGFSPSDLVTLAKKGRVIPYFEDRYETYNEKVISPFLQPGVPSITPHQMAVIRGIPITLMTEMTGWADAYRLANQDIENLKFPSQDCARCVALCYMIGLKEHFHGPGFIGWRAGCWASFAVSARVFDAVLQTECKKGQNMLSNIGGLPEGISIDYILNGLRVNYSPSIPIEAYAEVFDGKTAKALRRVVGQLLGDPLSRKYTQRLSAKIYDLNQQVEELAEGRAAKIFEAVSDMALYGGKKFIESKSQKYIRIPKKGFVKLAEWLASKGVDLQAKIGRKDWSIAQLYRARCKLERCK